MLGTSNPYASNSRVNLDFIDVWDGSSLANGTFEAELGNEERLFMSTGWNNINNTVASDGTYLRDATANIWFPFTGR